MRLGPDTLALLDASVVRPQYDRAGQSTGIVHLGVGAFHRAHQAVYTDDAMNAGDRDWMIAGVSLRSPTVRNQLDPQGGLYTVSQRSDDDTPTRLIGSIGSVLVGPENPDVVISALAAPTTRLVTLTVTEKGYHRPLSGKDGPGERHNESGRRERPATIYGYLHRGLARRRAAGVPGLTLLSCDNLAGNGDLLARQLTEYLDLVDPALARWFEAECTCPLSMVDRIVPATTVSDLGQVEAQIGLRDEAAVITEIFSQWVIEDRFAGPRPRWEVGGAKFVDDVRPFEIAKLRMLNGAHSALAYLGLERGLTFVHEAIADTEIRSLVDRLMRQEAAPTVSKIGDTDAYADKLLTRFSNARLPHQLRQIAMDGSQKIPQRWLATLSHHGDANRCPAIISALAAWIRFVRGEIIPVEDPMAQELADLWRTAGVQNIVSALFGPAAHFRPQWDASVEDLQYLQSKLRAVSG